MLFFQCIQEPGCFWLQCLHGCGECRLLVTVSTDHQWLCLKGLDAGIVHGQHVRRGRVIGDLYGGSDQRCLRLITFPTETDAGTFVYLPLFMVQECLPYDLRVQVSQRAAVPVELLQRGDPLGRDVHAPVLIVLADPAVGLFVVILLQEDLPVPVQLLQCFDLFRFGFCQI